MKEPPKGVQQWIYILEEGAGRIWVRRSLLVTIALALAGLFHLNRAHNFESPEAMDMAQLGRNIAEGRGYTTWNIRPLSVALQTRTLTNAGKSPFQLLQRPHADISNPPIFPTLVAGALKMVPASARSAMTGKSRTRPPAEVAIGVLNLFGLWALVFMVYRMTWGLFSRNAAIVAALVVMCCDIFWDFVFSGLPTLWLSALLCWVTLLAASAAEHFRHGAKVTLADAVRKGGGIGALLALACLTVYSTGWLLVPVALTLYFSAQKHQRTLAASCVVTFLIVVSPWLIRNTAKSGLPFGTATVAAYSGTKGFPEDRLERSLSPRLQEVQIFEIINKFSENERELVRNQLSSVGGTWFTAFFVVGLFLPSRSPLVGRVKWLVVSMLLVFLLVQPIIRTNISTLCPVYSTENLIVLLAPMFIAMAAGVMEDLWARSTFPFAGADVISKAFVVALCILPGLQTAVHSRNTVLSAPPYVPAVIAQLSNYVPSDALMMSDMPWGVSWYGRRPCVGLTLRVREDYREDFFAINDYYRSIRALYLSPVTADKPWQSGFVASPDGAWARLYMDFFLRGKVPEGFPLKFAFGGGEGPSAMAYPSAGHLLMADFQYW